MNSLTNPHINLLGLGAEEAMEFVEEDLVEIAEEADLIQAERIIDDIYDIFSDRGGRDGTKQKEVEESVRELEELMLAMNLDGAEMRVEQSADGFEVQFKKKKKSFGDGTWFHLACW